MSPNSPLTLSLSPQARLGVLAISNGHIRLRIWPGEGTLLNRRAKINSGVLSPLGERDRVRGSWAISAYGLERICL
jgi:hypothetical protein